MTTDEAIKKAPLSEEVPGKVESNGFASEKSEDPSDQMYEFGIAMSCGGCSGAVTRVLNKLDGVKSHNVSLDTQTATVRASEDLAYETVLNVIKRTNKTVLWGKANGKDMAIEPVAEPSGAAA